MAIWSVPVIGATLIAVRTRASVGNAQRVQPLFASSA
jgi:hypothetical protein